VRIGLRVDVDTLRGTRRGAPELGRILARHGITASFFFSVGPDNMGRHLWRLGKPTFLWKMLRTRAASLYGWDILLRGTLWPGPRIGERCREQIRAIAADGHEIGLHAWDHHAWQARVDRMDPERIRSEIRLGVEVLGDVSGAPPTCSAVAGWRCNDRVLEIKDAYGFRYNSDCRGRSVFRPAVGQKVLQTPQVPVTLPTFDELVGRGGVTGGSYNTELLKRLDPKGLNVLAIHAEVEGIACAKMFDDFLAEARARGVAFVPLGAFAATEMSIDRIANRAIDGREGLVACQESACAGR
jgi:undecaprenyl phosphate-alpha-L-ara4FN deformylase